MENFKEYNPVKFKETFQESELYNQITSNADIIVWEKLYNVEFAFKTPREIHVTKLVSLAPFYYLQFLIEKNPDKIYDIGCGMNYFKKFIPSIIGIDTDISSDIHGNFDKRFVSENSFDSVFSINSLHFITLMELRERIVDFTKIINKGGRGFLALNSQRMVERTSNKELRLMFPNTMTQDLLDSYIRTQFNNIDDINILCLDIDLTVPDEWMNGNIRVVFEKN